MLESLRTALTTVIRGKEQAVDEVLIGLLTGSHILVEDVPGVGKTTLAKALARALSVGFSRIQFTPDLLPSDILGAQVFSPKDGTFSFQPGPIFTNVLLADEINRASPRTQSALLEAMNEGQVTVDGSTHELPHPFLVIATQNPVDFQGTYPLPEAQLDRFGIRVRLGYPAIDEEVEILLSRRLSDPLRAIEPVADEKTLIAQQAAVHEIAVKPEIARYIAEICAATRRHDAVALGASPRAGLSMMRAAQARALLSERSYVSPDDIQSVASIVLEHRLMIRPGKSDSSAVVVQESIKSVAVPT